MGLCSVLFFAMKMMSSFLVILNLCFVALIQETNNKYYAQVYIMKSRDSQ